MERPASKRPRTQSIVKTKDKQTTATATATATSQTQAEESDSASSSSSSASSSSPPPSSLSAFVSQCFTSKANGDPRHYYVLCSQLASSLAESDFDACERWFLALSDFALYLTPAFSPALHESLFAIAIGQLPQHAINALVKLMLAHFTAHNKPTPIFALIIRSFSVSSPHSSLIHAFAARVAAIAPQAVNEFAILLMENFPHRRVALSVLDEYVRNFLLVLTYVPSLSDRLLAFLFEQILSIDVEVSVHAEAKEDNGCFSTSERACRGAGDLREKLDAIMKAVMEFFRSRVSDRQPTGGLQALINAAATSSAGASDLSSTDLFGILLRIFERSILRTHQCRFTQFLVFYYCSFKHVYAEAFLRWLLEKAFDRESSLLDRQNAALYIASFASRAAFLRHASTIVAFEMLLQWCVQYCQYHEKINIPPIGPLEAPRHAHFYRCFQACIYLFLFKQHAFAAMIDADDELRDKFHLQDLIDSNLNPLRYCLTAVVSEFDRVSRKLRVAECAGVIENNQRFHQESKEKANKDSGQTAATGSAHAAVTFDPQECFFPFDPFFLPRSAALLRPLYAHYQSLPDASPVHATSAAVAIPKNRNNKSSHRREIEQLSSSLSDIAVSPPTRGRPSEEPDDLTLNIGLALALPPAAANANKKRSQTIFSSALASDSPAPAGDAGHDGDASDADSDDSASARDFSFTPTYSPTFSPALPPLNPMAGLDYNSTQIHQLFQ